MLKRWLGKAKDAAPAARDTDADWRKLGRDEPYFGVLADPRFLRANLTAEALDDFYASGVTDIAYYLALMRARFGPFAPASALDFGCGVGRLTAALADVTGDALGVDIAEGMLVEARQRARPGLDFANVLPERAFDWIVSIIVFQHIDPARGHDLLRALLARLGPGGGVTLQITIFRDARFRDAPGGRLALGDGIERLDPRKGLAALAEGEMVMFDYDLSIVYALLIEGGVGEIAMLPTDHGGFRGALILARKPH
ncbi:class I SAM-dependent methyltransferase [Sphingomonas sp. BIUV-7]|uniref:Class I SAM-dependent methyltransferase n=1 Tax=Sphingomonas natans TaxID=3063330 RepID=A0ABT8YEJ5_9SPHN|nr:class I SAM-dependent methyltransferase [Sphingomonas sp. BIUV-7]MDO6416762.1 class I SAM-dependent methyltransferase [Sphingomonas sp. BIUV-7]